jgi:hypothetical protein
MSIPGNHDLKRPDPRTALSAAFRGWWADEIVREAFWSDPASEYRRAINDAFRYYVEWSNNNGLPRPADYQTGLLPGDFSATLAKGDARIGIVGLNTTFLQLSGDDFKGKLDVDIRQLNEACGGDSAAWLRQRHASFLLTHQPPDWLHERALERFRGGIYRPQNFIAHFYGHMHEQSSLILSEGGDTPRRHFQGISLFGLDAFGAEFDKRRFKFGYTAGRLEMDVRRGRLCLWPRVAVKLQSGDWRIVADPEQSLSEGTKHIRPIDVEFRNQIDTLSCLISGAPPDLALTKSDVASRRGDYLRRLKVESMARCVMRWRAAGVSDGLAKDFVANPLVGSPSAEMFPSKERRVVLLVGPIGSGKSLIGERLHQAAIERALIAPDAPLPVYLEAPVVVGHLLKAVEEEIAVGGGLTSQGVAVFLHESIGGETADVRALLNEARLLVNSWTNTTVVLLSRGTTEAGCSEEKVVVPPISEELALRLVNQNSGYCFTPSWLAWSNSVREAIRRPLFALLLGQYVRTSSSDGPRSAADLIANLVGEALRKVRSSRLEVEGLLRRVGAKLTHRGGGFMPISEVVSMDQIGDLELLLDVGLLTKRDQAIAFPLAILTEWFAAEALARDDILIDDIIHDYQLLDRWYFPLLIFIGTQSHEVATKILSPICKRDPGLASVLIERGLSQWGMSEEVLPPPAKECGERLLAITEVWMRSLQELTDLVAPIGPDKKLRPLGVRTSGPWLVAGWYFGSEPLERIVPLPEPVQVPIGNKLISTSWTHRDWSTRAARTGKESSWAWRWVRDEFATWITRVLRHKMLPPKTPAMRSEAAWQAAVAIAGVPNWPSTDIDINKIEQILSSLATQDYIINESSNTLYLQPLRESLQLLRQNGEATLMPPWSPPSSRVENRRIGPIWRFCSDEEITNRLEFVYSSAIEGYRQMVSDWFQPLSNRLLHAITMPSMTRIFISIVDDTNSFRPPVISYREEPLPRGTGATVKVSLSRNGAPSDSTNKESYENMVAKYKSLRPEIPFWLPLYIGGSFLATDTFKQTAITVLVYSWLEQDLQNLCLFSSH